MSKELERFTSLTEYFKVLIDSYPEPISQTELAMRSNVTKSAISKVRTRLLEFCDQTIGLFDRKLLLKTDFETFTNLLILFAKDLKFGNFLQSDYARSLIEKANIHGKLVKDLKELSYEAYFSKEDTKMMIEIILYNISALKIPAEFKKYTRKVSKNDPSSFMSPLLLYVFNEAVSKFNLTIFRNDAELMSLIRLRDKFHAFILGNAEAILRKWDFVKTQKPEKQETCVRVYKETIRYFLHKYMTDFTNKVQQRAKEIGIAFPEEYGKLGALFKKEKTENIMVMPASQKLRR